VIEPCTAHVQSEHELTRDALQMTLRTKLLPLVPIAAALLSACSTMPASMPLSASPSAHSSLRSSANLSIGTPYFLQDGRPQEVRRDAMLRYMCLSGQPVQCQCLSRLSSTCQCSCRSL
jgi:hypothetical protein